MDDYCVELDRETHLYCRLHLFTNVENISEVRQKILTGKSCCCVIKASLMVDAFHAIAATNKAVLNAKQNRLITKNMYTEILFCLSMSKNISRSLTEFGINDNDRNILVILIHKLGEEPTALKEISIKGEEIPVSRIQELTNTELIKKIYKIQDDELRVSSLSDAVVSRISCKDFMLLK